MSGTDGGEMDSADQIDSIEHGVRSVLMGGQFLMDAVLAGESASITIPMSHDLRRLLEMTSDLAVAQGPDLVQELLEVRKYLEQSVRLIDGGFHRSMVNTQIQNMIALLEDLL